jgi:hypothetical protein
MFVRPAVMGPRHGIGNKFQILTTEDDQIMLERRVAS